MKILIINQYAVPESEPGLTRHFMLGRELVRRGHDVTIVTTSFNHTLRTETRLQDGQAALEEVIDGIRFLWIRSPAYHGNSSARIRNMLVFAWRVWTSGRLRRLPEPDVVIGSSPQLLATLAAMRIARRKRVPFVLEVRDLWPETFVQLGDVPRSHPTVLVLGAIERHLYRHSDKIITLLGGSATYIREHGGDGAKISWIPNGIELSIDAPEPAPLHSEGRDFFEVAYSGTHGFANALDAILDSAALLKDGFSPPIRFRFVGDGPAKARLMERALIEGISNVTFDDAVPKAEVEAKLAYSSQR